MGKKQTHKDNTKKEEDGSKPSHQKTHPTSEK